MCICCRMHVYWQCNGCSYTMLDYFASSPSSKSCIHVSKTMDDLLPNSDLCISSNRCHHKDSNRENSSLFALFFTRNEEYCKHNSIGGRRMLVPQGALELGQIRHILYLFGYRDLEKVHYSP